MKYRVLYLFQSAGLLICEIKRLDLPATAPADQLFHWLHYVPATNQLTQLTFVTMASNPPFELREFQQGMLHFSAIEGIYRPTGTTAALALYRDYLPELPAQLATQLSSRFA